MSATFEKIETNKVKITMNISPERFEEGMKHSYNINKSKINIPGFRKGKIPRIMLEKVAGKSFLYEDAVNYVLPDAYENAIDELKLEPVSRPEIDVTEVDAEKGAVITAEVVVKPEVTVINYKGLTYKKPDTTVTDEDIDKEIETIREKNSRIVSITDRPIEDGDIAVIDFEGFIDDVPFEGGTGNNHELTIGSHSFIDTFEEQLIGLNVDDEKEVNVTFPAEYNEVSLQNKPAKFKVKINEVKAKELPVIDDEFAQDVSEFDNLNEYKSDIRAKLQDSKNHDAEHEIENQVVDALSEIAEIELPEEMVDSECRFILRDFEQRLKTQGMSLEMYTQYTGMTTEQMMEGNKESARKRVIGRLALEAVAKAENFEITEDEFNKEIDRMAQAYKMENEKMLSVLRDEDKEGLKTDLRVQKALKYLVENAIAID